MKDIRTFIIGFLSAVCIFLITAQSKGNLGNIEVKSISVKNSDGTEVAWVGPSTVGGGFIETYNSNGSKSAYLGTGAGSGGLLRTFGPSGKNTAFIGTSGSGEFGFMQTFNSYGNVSAYIGTSKHNQGLVLISDISGEPFWGEMAE